MARIYKIWFGRYKFEIVFWKWYKVEVFRWKHNWTKWGKPCDEIR